MRAHQSFTISGPNPEICWPGQSGGDESSQSAYVRSLWKPDLIFKLVPYSSAADPINVGGAPFNAGSPLAMIVTATAY